MIESDPVRLIPGKSAGPRAVTIGNVYGHGFHPAAVAEVENLGFALRPGASRYAGSQVMRFIDFAEGPALELIDVTDPQAYADFVPAGMTPYCPGISLLLPHGSRSDLESFADSFADLQPYRLHAAYDGSDDSEKPGWNYLNFGVPLVPGTFIYLTALDGPRPAPTKVTNHGNSVTGVRGLWFDLPEMELRRLSELVAVDPVGGAFRIGGAAVWSREAVPDSPDPGDKRFPLRAMVLEAEDLRCPKLEHAHVTRVSFQSRPALLVRTNPNAWDLLLVERGSPA